MRVYVLCTVYNIMWADTCVLHVRVTVLLQAPLRVLRGHIYKSACSLKYPSNMHI